MRLHAGYKIIYSSQIDHTTEIVLGWDIMNGMYVTWMCIDRNNYFWGHYFRDEVDALLDLADRIRKEKNNG